MSYSQDEQHSSLVDPSQSLQQPGFARAGNEKTRPDNATRIYFFIIFSPDF